MSALAQSHQELGINAGATKGNKTDHASSKFTIDKLHAKLQEGDRICSSFSGGGHLSLGDVDPVTIQIRDLEVSVNTAPSWFEPTTYPELLARRFDTARRMRALIQHVSVDLMPGSLTAIIGSSGSGKTTLLNSIAERATGPKLDQKGLITFNQNIGINSIEHAYVMQTDILLPTLTVRETLQYSANLRLLGKSNPQSHKGIVEDVMTELGLKGCANTRIGNGRHGGCSGGERRRVSIGVQLLANPSVLFLDEPTTGLDATSAFQLVRTLKVLAQNGRTIVMTVHQPRSEIWSLLDNLIVLSKGGPIYSGCTSGCLPWLDDQGLQIPPFVNPAEFIVNVSAIDNRNREVEKETDARVDALKKEWAIQSRKLYAPLQNTAEMDTYKRTARRTDYSSFFRQISVLTNRTIRVTYRDPLGMTSAIFGALIMSITSGCMYYNLQRDQAGIKSRQGGLYLAAAMQGYVTLIFEVYRMTIDIPMFDREYAENCVDPLPFIISRRLARLPTEDIPVPLLFATIFYFMAGFDSDIKKCFIFFVITLVNHYVAVSCATSCVVVIRHFAGASLIANLISTLQSVAGGLLIQTNTVPIYVRWTKWITFTFYAFGAYISNEFYGSFYDCPSDGGKSSPECVRYTGEYVIESLGFPNSWVWRPIVVLLSFVIVFTLHSTIGLHFFKVNVTVARSYSSKTDLSVGKEKMLAQSVPAVQAIDLRLENFTLALERRMKGCRRSLRKPILNQISTTFKSGVLNVVMGPSGSGKTSLLNAMALRLPSSIGTTYHTSGNVTFNDAIPSQSVIRSTCSYVCQDDNALLPSLTVRETLYYAAGLRLPSYMTEDEKNQQAEQIVIKMGLKDCANNIIGNDWIKGASGGEKRRVSIAIQILHSPRILLLDEPTSGLDAFTAMSIMEVLHGLAQEGRTLILTIHQPQSDLFQHFGNVLLLARGGLPVYSGLAKDMLGYFEKHGLRCPPHTNPADFALDMITVDLQRDGLEAFAKRRVQKLIDAGKNEGLEWKSRRNILPGNRKGKDSYQENNDNSQLDARQDERVPSETKRKPQNWLTQTITSVTTPRRSFKKGIVSTPAELCAFLRQPASFSAALSILLRRAIINTYRQPQLIIARTMQAIGLSLVFTLFFAPLRDDYYGVQNRMGFIQEIGALYFVGMLQNIAAYPNERDAFYYEDDDGVYGVEAFLVSYTILEVPFEIISSVVFGLLCTMVVGLPRTATTFFVCVFSCFSVLSCGESLGIMFNTLSKHTGFAVNMIGVFMAIANTMAGILVIDMPGPLRAVNYLSPLRYTTRLVASYSLRNVEFTCNNAQRLSDGSCPIKTGEDVLNLYNLNESILKNVALLATCIIVYRLIAWFLLKGMRKRW